MIHLTTSHRANEPSDQFAKSIKQRATANGQLTGVRVGQHDRKGNTRNLNPTPNRGVTPESDRAGQPVKQGSFLQSDLRRSKTRSRLQPATAVAKREYRPFRPG